MDTETNLCVLQPSRKKRLPGDVSFYQMPDQRFRFGRLISTDATIGGFPPLTRTTRTIPQNGLEMPMNGPEQPISRIESSLSKLYMCEFGKRVANAALDLMGPDGQLKPGQAGAPLNGRFERSYRYTVVDSIGGGASEIQKNIIARRGLGLPQSF